MSANLFVPAGSAPIAESAAKALAEILASAPSNAVRADVIIREDTGGRSARFTLATRIDGDNWAVGIGGFHEREADGDRTTGVGVQVSWR